MAATGKLDRRVVRTRAAIADAFYRLIAANGIEKVTVSAIAREANIDRKTFYLHYDSVNDLVNRNTEQALERILHILKEKGADKDPIERVRIVLAAVNATLTDNLEIYQNVASSLSLNQILDRFEQAIVPAFNHEGLDASVIDSSDIRMKLQFYIAGALSLYTTWLASDHSTPIETVSDTIEGALKSTVFPTLTNPAL